MSSRPTLSVLRTLVTRFAIAVGASIVLLAILITAVNAQFDAKVGGIERVDVTLDTTPREAKAGNYLIVGSDSRGFVEDEQDLDSFGEVDGERADAIMIAHVDPEVDELFVVSIPRDTVVDLPDGSSSKIADVWGQDGAQALIDVIAYNFDVDLTHYLSIDFDGFRRIIDLVGPIDIYFEAPARDLKTGLNVPEAGCVELDGEQALAFVRSRAYEESWYGSWWSDPTADLGRIRRQQAFLRQVAMQAREEVYASPLEFPAIVDAAIAPLRADQAFGRDQILGFVQRFRDVDPYDPAMLEMVTLPVVPGPEGTGLGSILVLEQPGADEVFERLRTWGPQSPPPTDPGAEPTVPPVETTPPTTVPVDPEPFGWPDLDSMRC